MLPTLQHIPPRSIVRIPGPPIIGSRRPQVTFGKLFPPTEGGFPTSDMIIQWFADTGAPVWFAVSDNGAGFIPWGFWQFALYPTGEGPGAGFLNLAFSYAEVAASAPGAAMAGLTFAAFNVLRGQGITAGFADAAEIAFRFSAVQDPSGPNPTESMIITGPYGQQLTGFYSGPEFNAGTEGSPDILPMMLQAAGYDNPLFMALWSPGNRALLRATESETVPSRYPYYPYPSDPPVIVVG